jgi:hypothetical protein
MNSSLFENRGNPIQSEKADGPALGQIYDQS